MSCAPCVKTKKEAPLHLFWDCTKTRFFRNNVFSWIIGGLQNFDGKESTFQAVEKFLHCFVL